MAILLYADDVALLAESAEELQDLLDILNAWCSRWMLNVNSTKSAVMHVRPKSAIRTTAEFLCGQERLPVVSEYKYLGLLFTQHVDHEAMATCAAKSASRALGLLIAKAKSLGGMPHATFNKLYDSMVWPVLDYGAAIWGTRDYSVVNAVHHRACRFFLGVGRFTPSAAINGDMGWRLPIERQWSAVSRLWHRLSAMPVDRLSHRIFVWGDNAATSRFRNWHFRVHQQFNSLGVGQYTHPGVVRSLQRRPFLRAIEAGLTRQRDQLWSAEINRVGAKRGAGLNKLRTYRSFKQVYGTEFYVNQLLPYTHRSALAKFRCGTAPLKIETGRYEGLPLDRRTCFFCPDTIESELHALIECPLYDDLRINLFSSASNIYPDFIALDPEAKLQLLLSSEFLASATSRTCRHLLNRRFSFIYS